MSTRSILVVLGTSLLIVAGCNKLPATPAPAASSAAAASTGPGWVKGTADGVSCEVRGEGSSSDLVVEGHHEFTAGHNKLRIEGGHAIANDKDYGPVKSGDSVLLDADGAVTINGQKR